MILRVISSCFLYNYHSRLLLTNGNKEMRFLHILFYPVPCFPDHFQSYLEGFDEYPSKDLDYFIEDDYQSPLCSGIDKSKDLPCLKKDPCDNFPQLPLITLLCCVYRGVAGEYVFDVEFPLGQTLESKGWLNFTSLSLSFQCFKFPLRIFRSSTRSSLIPSRALECEDVLGS
jgi:hypothetical protein